MYSDQNHAAGGAGHIPWNKARLIGPKRPCKLRETCKQDILPPHASSLVEPDKRILRLLTLRAGAIDTGKNTSQ